MILVGAFNANGSVSTYSSPGANLWISAPGGEHGFDEPALITTTLSGCESSDLDFISEKYTFNHGKSGPNGQCNYMNNFNGTSAAAPVVTGLVALFLETNPSATSTDVKNFLKNDGSKLLPGSEWIDQYTNDLTTDYWSESFNNRGAANRVAFDPFASDTIPKFTGVTLNGISIKQS